MSKPALRILFAAAVIGSVLYVWMSSAQMPDPVASHFAADGRANSRMSRDAYRLFMTGMTLLIPLLLVVFQALLPRVLARFVSIPRRDYWLATPERRAQMVDYLERHTLVSGLAPPLFFAGIQWLVIDANSRMPPVLNNTLFLVMGGLFVAWVVTSAITLSLHFRRTG
jgi:hypothetical protein